MDRTRCCGDSHQASHSHRARVQGPEHGKGLRRLRPRRSGGVPRRDLFRPFQLGDTSAPGPPRCPRRIPPLPVPVCLRPVRRPRPSCATSSFSWRHGQPCFPSCSTTFSWSSEQPNSKVCKATQRSTCTSLTPPATIGQAPGPAHALVARQPRWSPPQRAVHPGGRSGCAAPRQPAGRAVPCRRCRRRGLTAPLLPPSRREVRVEAHVAAGVGLPEQRDQEPVLFARPHERALRVCAGELDRARQSPLVGAGPPAAE